MECSPLSIISGNRRRHSEYNAYQRGLIAGAQVCGVTPGALRKRFGIPKSSAQYILLNVLQNNNGNFASRSGRPRLLSIRDERHIIRIVRHESKITYRELRERVGVSCSHDIIYRLLKEEGIIN